MTNSKATPLLLIEPDPAQAAQLRDIIAKDDHLVVESASADEAESLLAAGGYSLLLLNLDPLGSQALQQVEKLSRRENALPVIAYTSRGSVGGAVEAMRAGAYDFLLMPVAPERLLVTVRNALERASLRQTVETYRKVDRPGFQGFIGSSPAMQAVYRMIESAAASKATVFVTGESGTGKEVCASAIHHLSPRVDKPFIALNCAAIPKDLIESEVFGHVKGAFTGATADRAGAASQADGGTLFLDEIGEMDHGLQSKLLRFLQTGTFQRVGGSKLEEVDVRIVCATNRDPLEEVKAGRFREDLYYRLHVIPVTLPALRERGHDVVEIAHHLLDTYAAEEKKAFHGFSPEVEQMFGNYDWPGNVRQLQNIIRNIVVMNQGEWVVPAMVPPPVGGRWARPYGFGMGQHAMAPVGDMLAASSRPETTTIRPLAEVEREAIEAAINACEGNVPKAAALLDVSPSTIYRKRLAWAGVDPQQAQD